MKANALQTQDEQPITHIKKNTLNIEDNTSVAFNKIYDVWIKPIELSPLMFNYFHWVVNLTCSNLL